MHSVAPPQHTLLCPDEAAIQNGMLVTVTHGICENRELTHEGVLVEHNQAWIMAAIAAEDHDRFVREMLENNPSNYESSGEDCKFDNR